MILLIQNVGSISIEKLEDVIEELFGAVVIVEIYSSSRMCFSKRSATMKVVSSSPELQQFIQNINTHGSDTFVSGGIVYKVTMYNINKIDLDI